MNEKTADVTITGAGPAGVSAAITLAKAGKKVLLVERGDKAGDKNVFGGCIYEKQTEEIFPGFQDSAPIERVVTRQNIFMLTESSSSEFSYSFGKKANDNAYIVNRSKWDNWCVTKAQDEGVYYAPKTLVKNLIIENGTVRGIETEYEKIYSDIVIAADGVNSLCALQLGLRNAYSDEDAVVNVKEVIRLPKNVLEDRFLTDENTGVAAKIIGGPLKNMFAMGFMYTNKDSVSLGLGVSLDELKKHSLKPYELLDKLKEHPSIAPYIKGGETIEYSSHMIPEGSFDKLPKVYDNRIMLVGDAARFVNNIHQEGTNFAMLSGKLAAETALFAIETGDFSASSLSLYYKKLKESIIIKDLKTHNNTVKVLKKHIKTVTELYPELAAEFFDLLTAADNIPKRDKYNKFLREIISSGAIVKSIPLGLFALGKCFKR